MVDNAYIITKEVKIIRQEGDDSVIKIAVPNVFAINQNAVVTFTVKYGDNVIFTKNNSTIILEGQMIKIPILPIDTKGKANSFYRWELQVLVSGFITTIGRGDFSIIGELIK